MHFSKLTRILSCVCALVLLPFCSSQKSWKNNLEQHVQQQSLEISGRKWLSTKSVFADESLKQSYLQHFPGEKLFESKSANIFVVGVSSLGREPLSTKAHRFKNTNGDCVLQKEITDSTIIERQIPFAFPFNRVFIVECPNKAELVLETPVGSIPVWRP